MHLTTGEKIRTARERAGLFQTELADALGISISALLTYEKDRQSPRVGLLERIAVILGVPADSLVGDPVTPIQADISDENSSKNRPG